MFHGNFQTRRICYRLFPVMTTADAMLADAVTLLTTDRPALPGARAAALVVLDDSLRRVGKAP